jgi:hypothetical protein
MRRVGPIGFEEALWSALERDGPMGGNDADGFLLHLDHVFRGLEALTEVDVRRTDEDACRFRITATFAGEVDETVAAIVRELENEIANLRYDSVVAVESSVDPIGVRFVTGVVGVGVATVCIEATPGPAARARA